MIIIMIVINNSWVEREVEEEERAFGEHSARRETV